MLLDIVCRVRDLNIYNLAILISNKLILWVYETTIRLDIESCVTCDNLGVKLWVNLNSVGLDKLLTSIVVTLRLDTLNLTKKLTEQRTKLNKVIYNNISLAILLYKLDNILCLTLLVAPLSDKLACNLQT